MCKKKFEISDSLRDSLLDNHQQTLRRHRDQQELVDNLGELVKKVLCLLETDGKLTITATANNKPRFTIAFEKNEEKSEDS